MGSTVSNNGAPCWGLWIRSHPLGLSSVLCAGSTLTWPLTQQPAGAWACYHLPKHPSKGLSRSCLQLLSALCTSHEGRPIQSAGLHRRSVKEDFRLPGPCPGWGASPPRSLITQGPGHPTLGDPPGKSLRPACSRLTQPPGALILPSFWRLCSEALSWDCADQQAGAAAPTEGGRGLLRTGDCPSPALLPTKPGQGAICSRPCCLRRT